MTAYSMTMSATVSAFGGAPTDKWLVYNWNAFKWGEGTATIGLTVSKLLTGQTVTPTAGNDFTLVKLLTGETVTPAAANNFQLRLGVAETVQATGSVSHLYIQDSNNYFKVFPEGVTDLVLETTPTWTSGASTPVSWATAAVGTTVWS